MKQILIYLFLVLMPVIAVAQDGMRKIAGTVLDEEGEPLIGATVRVSDRPSGTVTDADGRFTLMVPVGKAVKVNVSYVGYSTSTVEVTPKMAEVTVHLKVNAGQFDEVVVIGYGTAKKTGLTASIETVSGEALQRIPSMNVDQALGGQVAGLGVRVTTGDPSSAKEASISVRGNNGEPLLVIDGVPRLGTNTGDGEMRLSDLNPDDIESISVLKDAAASAVYGSRAANGVILVQTKRGKNDGRARVNYRGQFNFEQATYLPKFLNARQFAELYNRAVENSGSEVYTPYDLDEIGRNPNLYGDENMLDYLDKWGHSQRHSLSVSGGIGSIRYFISGGYTNTKGLYSSVGRNRYNYSAKIDADIFKGLTLSFDVTGSISDYKTSSNTVIDDAYEYSPLQVLRFTDGNLASISGGNPLVDVEGIGGYTKESSDMHTLNAVLRYKIPRVEGLEVYLKGTVDLNHHNTTQYSNPVALYLYDEASGTTSVDPNTVYPKAKISMLDRHQKVTNILVEGGINYNRTFAGKHDVTGLLVLNYQDYHKKYLRGINDNLPGPYPEVIGNTSTGNLSGSESYSERASIVGRASYGFDNRYFAEFSFRVDGSTRFAPEHRWGFFPTVSASWVISNEPFFKSVPPAIMSFAKIRASAGILGDDGVASEYSYMQYYNFTFGEGYNFGGLWTPGLLPSISSFPNSDLTWGKSKDFNVGADVGFWDNRLSASVEWYQRTRTNMVNDAEAYLFPPSVGTGGVVPHVNMGKVRFRGVDVSLRHLNTIGDLKYDVSFNIGTAYDKVLDWGDESSLVPSQRMKGRSSSVYAVYEAAGLFQSYEEIASWPVDQDGRHNATLAPGDIKYIDQDGNGTLGIEDITYVNDSSNPKVSYGFSLGASWKGIYFDAQFQGAGGYNQMINELYTLENQSLQRFQDYHWDNTWTPENPGAEYPRIKFASTGDNNRRNSTFWIRRCNYLRMRSLTVGYNFPARLLRKAHISTLNVAFQAGNLFTVSSLDGIDPESLRGYPLSRSYGVSLNFGF